MATRAPQQRMDIGNVISMGFRALGRHFLPFLGFALLLVGLPTFLVQYLTWGDVMAGEIPFASASYWLGTVIWWISSYLLQGIVVRTAVVELSGRRPDLGDGVMVAVGMLFPMIGLSIVTGFGTAIGLVLLIVPGIILMLMWSVAVPVLIEERRGVFDSLGRSAELTRGSKGWIFLLMLLYFGVSSMISGAVFAFTGFGMDVPNLEAMMLPIALTSAAAQALNGLLFAVMVSGLYVELRQFREGAAPEQLAAIFE